MNLGFAEYGPSNGIGPFSALFNKGVNLRYVHNLNDCDAIVLWGGADISPSLYDEKPFKFSGPPSPSERDTFEWEMIHMAVAANIPIIGVCRGAQLLCAYAGGKLIQDMDGHGNGNHTIVTNEGNEYTVSSCHHQMMYPYDIPHQLLAWSKFDRASYFNPPETPHAKRMKAHEELEPEVVFFPEIKGMAIQCHPEWHTYGSEMLFNSWIMQQIKEKCLTKIEQEC